MTTLPVRTITTVLSSPASQGPIGPAGPLSQSGIGYATILEDATVPASGSVALVLSVADFLLSNSSIFGSINGVEGVLSRSGNTYTFTRDSTGTAFNIQGGSTAFYPLRGKDIVLCADDLVSLRSRPAPAISERVFVPAVGEDEWGIYQADLSDTTSIDDGKAIIVGNYSTRWKLVASGGGGDIANTDVFGSVFVGDRLMPSATGEVSTLINPLVTGDDPSNVVFVSRNGFDSPDVYADFKTGALLIKNNRQTIVNNAYNAITPPTGISETDCKRDIGYIVDAIAADLGNSANNSEYLSNIYSIQAGKAYYELDGTRRIGINEVAPTSLAITSVKTQIITLIGAGQSNIITELTNIISGYLQNGLGWSSAPVIKYGVQRGRYLDGSNLIKANRDYIVNSVLAALQASPYNYTIPGDGKCARDLNYVIDAVSEDVRSLSNIKSITVARNYYDRNGLVIGSVGSPSELTKTITAFTLLRQYCMNAVQNKLPNSSNIAEVDGQLNVNLFAVGGLQYEGSECATVASAVYSLCNIIIGYLENGLLWEDAPKQNIGLADKQLPGRSWQTAYRTIKRALAEVDKFIGTAYTVRVGSGDFYEDNPLVLNQPSTAVVGDNLRTTKVRPLNHGLDLFKVNSGCYLNYLVFRDNYAGGYGILDSSTQSNPRQISAIATVFKLFPGHTITATPGRFKDGANLIRANRLYIINTISSGYSSYNAAPIVDAVIADLRNSSNINVLDAIVVNNQTAITATKNLILQAIRNELANTEANQTSGTNFSAFDPGDGQYDAGDCANVQATASTLVDIIASVANGGVKPERNSGDLLLVDQEFMEVASINGDTVTIAARGVGSTASRHISGAVCSQNAKTFRYAAAFKDGVNIFLSPYVQNCSNISVLGKTVTLPNGELDDTKTLAGGILVDGGVLANTTPIRSMVMDAFTQIVYGSVGFHHKRDGYAQLVSVFQVFEDIGILAESGGYASVTNSATNFGNVGLKSHGYSASAFPFYKGTVSAAVNQELSFSPSTANIITSSFTAASDGKTRVTLVIEADKINQFVVGQLITVEGHATAAANGVGLPVVAVQGSDRTVTYISNTAYSSGFTNGGQTGTIRVSTGRIVTKLTVQGFQSRPLANYIVKVSKSGGGYVERTDGIEYVVEEATELSQLGLTTITLQVKWEDEVSLPSVGTSIELRQPSSVNSSSHTFEFIGTGINYTALPENGGITDPTVQTVEVEAGKVYCSATDQDGNFTVGPYFNVDLRSGKVTFSGTVSLGVIDEIQLKNSPGVPIREFAIDNDLNGDLGAANTRLATQRATRDFVKNKLGNLFNKTSGTSGGSNVYSGQLVELNSQGFISEAQLPPKSPFNVYNVADQAARLALSQANQGDYAAQSDNGTVYVLKTTQNGGASVDGNWATLPSGVVSAANIAGVINPANLGSGTANLSTFLSGGSSYLALTQSVRPGLSGAITIGSDAVTPNYYNATSKVGQVSVDVNVAAFGNQQTSGSSSLGVARFAYEDFTIDSNNTVSLRVQAVELDKLQQISAGTVLGNKSGATGNVSLIKLDTEIPRVNEINVTYNSLSQVYVFSINGVSMGSERNLILSRGSVYKFNLSVSGHPFYLTTNPDSISSTYTSGLTGTNGTEVTNDSTVFVFKVPTNAPKELWYKDANVSTNRGRIIIDNANYVSNTLVDSSGIGDKKSLAYDSTSQTVKYQSITDLGAISSTSRGAANGVASLDGNAKLPVAQLPTDIDASKIKGVEVLDSAKANGYALVYDNASQKLVYAAVSAPITSINNITGTLNINKGGTGATTAGEALTNLGALASSSRGTANGVASLDATSRLPIGQLPTVINATQILGVNIIGTGIANGKTLVYDSTQNALVYAQAGGLISSFEEINDTLEISQGGTGATTATQALNNLGIRGTQTANYVWAAPSSSNGAPSFRALVVNDIPNLTISKISDLNKGLANGVASLDGNARIDKNQRSREFVVINNPVGDSFTLDATHHSTFVQVNTVNAGTIVLPSSTTIAPVGFDCIIFNAGSTNISFTGGTFVIQTNSNVLKPGAKAHIIRTSASYRIYISEFLDAEEVGAIPSTTKLNQITVPDGSLSLNSQKIINLGTPTLDTDAATKAYVDSGQIIAGGGLTKSGTTINVVGTTGRIVVNADSIDLDTVTQNDTTGTDGINFVQSISKDSYGRITSRVLANIRTASTSQTGIVQLHDSTNSTSTDLAATANSVKVTYDLASAAISLTQKGANDGVASLNSSGKLTETQIPTSARISVVNSYSNNTYTLQPTDEGKIIELDNITANTTVIVPSTLPLGFNCFICQVSDSSYTVTIQGGSNVNLRNSQYLNTILLASQWSTAMIYKRNSTDFVVSGDLA